MIYTNTQYYNMIYTNTYYYNMMHINTFVFGNFYTSTLKKIYCDQASKTKAKTNQIIKVIQYFNYFIKYKNIKISLYKKILDYFIQGLRQ